MRGFSRGADTRTSCLGTRLMIRLTTDETQPELQFITLYEDVNVNGCVAWSLPSKGITEDLSPPFLLPLQKLLFLIQCCMSFLIAYNVWLKAV